jgi:SAM-dependent methyltransferase
MSSQIDFGYPWFLSYGHLAIAALVLPFFLLGRASKWPKPLTWVFGALTLWSVAAFAVSHFALDVNARSAPPPAKFLASGAGRVLDMGAGTGRSTLMVLDYRPQATVVALDLFGKSFERHFGSGQSGEERLLANLKAAGVEQRTTIQAGDMRKLPFEAASFDGVVSCYAIDHLNHAGIVESLGEAARVLRPGGDFFLSVIAKDFWVKFTFGPIMLHSGTRGPGYWGAMLQNAGLQVVEQGNSPATLYFLTRKP